MSGKQYDVIVVGGGNAALSAALSAVEGGASVLVLERAPEHKRGGNSAFTGGGFRMVHHGAADIKKIVPDLSDEDIAKTDFGEYTAENYFDDLGRITQYHIDPELADIIVNNSTDTVHWLMQQGVKFVPNYGRQAFNHNGRFKFFGGVVIYANGGGAGLIEAEIRAAEKRGVEIRYGTRAVSLLRNGAAVGGVRVIVDGIEEDIHATAVVLACGGFEANREWRARYLGPGWEMAKVRGTRYNTGDGIKMALDFGAQSYGQWSGCHSVSWERYANDFGDVDGQHSAGYRHSYPYSIMVNAEGKRFLDEGADFRNYTYAKYGRIVLQQPGSYAWQVFDAQVAHLIRDEYKMRGATKVKADTLEELADKMGDVDYHGFLNTVREYNDSIKKDVDFDPNIKDGKSTVGLAVTKSNWANTIEKGPFEAYSVGCGITFTFGGLKINTEAQVLDIEDQPLSGVFAAGELVGGLYYFNYPGSTGLMAGAVFGRIAGRSAAAYVSTKAAKQAEQAVAG
ncbi:tricarballylate dehydrogenase [Shinella sp. BE166]|uniref:FAD-dependent tricarballylate dehydrogenase TcuA n=1 Tax=Shinella sp. BE166 TaxID=3373918 RepID=UPI003EBE9412